jgi:hypothetical protein
MKVHDQLHASATSSANEDLRALFDQETYGTLIRSLDFVEKKQFLPLL